VGVGQAVLPHCVGGLSDLRRTGGIVQGWTYDSEWVLDIARCNLHRVTGLLLFVAQLLLERG